MKIFYSYKNPFRIFIRYEPIIFLKNFLFKNFLEVFVPIKKYFCIFMRCELTLFEKKNLYKNSLEVQKFCGSFCFYKKIIFGFLCFLN